MPQKRFQPEEIIGKRRHADGMLGQGKKVAEIIKVLDITDVTSDRGRQEFGGMTTAKAKRLKGLEREKGQLWKIVADLTRETRVFQEVAKGHVGAPPAPDVRHGGL